MDSVIQLGIAFILGILSKVLADWFILKIKKRGISKEKKKKFQKHYTSMKTLFDAIYQDILQEDYRSTRTLFILPSKSIPLNSTGKAFVYYENEHNDLANWVNTLTVEGWWTEITSGKTRKFILSEDFVNLLEKYIA